MSFSGLVSLLGAVPYLLHIAAAFYLLHIAAAFYLRHLGRPGRFATPSSPILASLRLQGVTRSSRVVASSSRDTLTSCLYKGLEVSANNEWFFR